MEELCCYPLFRLREMILEGQIHPKELLEMFLNRIERENPRLNAFVSIRGKEVLGEAEKVFSHSLPGIPIGVEDTFQVKGSLATYGSLLLKDHLSEEDDLEISRLKKAGCVVIGKTNLSEFGFSPYTQNKLIPPTLNPLTNKICLGSSGGAAAAVAGGLVPASIGSDATGGVRLPAYDCKLFGIKPTRGRIPLCRSYLIPTAEKLFHQKGIIARDPKDIALLLHVLAKPDCHDLDCCCVSPIDYYEKMEEKMPHPLRIKFSYDLGAFPADSANLEAFQKKLDLLRRSGHELIEAKCNFSKEMLDHYKSILACERYFPLLSLKEKQPKFTELLDSCACRWLCLASEVSGIDYAAGLFYAQWLREEIESLLSEADLFLTPCLPAEPYDSLLGPWAFMIPFNLSGHPALVLPSGVQVIGKYFDESLLLRFSMEENGRS